MLHVYCNKIRQLYQQKLRAEMSYDTFDIISTDAWGCQVFTGQCKQRCTVI